MFLANKYTKIYFQIVYKRKFKEVLQKSKNLYTENHHIIPRCIFKDDSLENMVRLTAREHYVIHWLLLKMIDSKKDESRSLRYAFLCMNFKKSKNQKRYVNSKGFETSRIILDDMNKHRIQSEKTKLKKIKSMQLYMQSLSLTERKMKYGSKGSKNGFYNKEHSKETLEIISKKQKQNILNGKVKTDNFKGHKHSKESIEKIKKTTKENKDKKLFQQYNQLLF